MNDREKSTWSLIYQIGYDNAAVCFGYIPDFKNDDEKKEFQRGLKDGYAEAGLRSLEN